MGDTAKQARMMQIPPRAMNDSAAHALVDRLTLLFANPMPAAAFETQATAMFQGEGRDWFQHVHGLAMIRPEILATLSAAARASKGAVLEIGPYVGASTLALIFGLKNTKRALFTIEAGGASDHPIRGSDNILRDLKANVAAFGVSDRVQILEGWADEAAHQLPDILSEKIGFLFVDADGSVDVHINDFKRLLAPDCILAFDDWKADVKGVRVRRTVEKLIQHKAIIPYGVINDDTWFGRINGEHGLRQFCACQEFHHDSGHAYWAAEPYLPTPSDNSSGDFSKLELFEDGKPLGPAHAKHSLIREQGRGAYSHWRGHILFSSSDNSDPRSNGRRYTARVAGEEGHLN